MMDEKLTTRQTIDNDDISVKPESVMNLQNQVMFNHRLREHVCVNLNNLEVRKLDAANRKHAAVAITITNCDFSTNIEGISFQQADSGRAAFILTVRTSKLKNHAGQWAFPGGRIDVGESPEQAAIRELQEEVGLGRNASHILGRLDDYATRSGYLITPVVVWGGSNVALNANPDEVEAIHRIPISELLRSDAPILEPVAESEHPVLKMPLGKNWFAAPTAAIAYQFREVAIMGRQTRVAHFEQPYFAWK